jgi:hypothetical protein
LTCEFQRCWKALASGPCQLCVELTSDDTVSSDERIWFEPDENCFANARSCSGSAP